MKQFAAWVALGALGVAGTAMAQGNLTDLGTNKLQRGNLANTMNWQDCFQYSGGKTQDKFLCGKAKCKGEPCDYVAPEYSFSYWEPAALIEVSCRNGYSMVAPGLVPSRGTSGASSPQSCFVPTGKGGRRWFFEARVWAINGYPGAAREQSSNGGKAEDARKCTQDQHDIHEDRYWGYGIKWDQFSRGAQTGPGGSWVAYMSDNQQSWAQDTGGAGGKPSTSKCEGTNVEACWGSLTRSGWVSHPNQAVAAVTAGWRAFNIAQQSGLVSPPGNGGGYKLNMDYPFIMSTSPYAQSMKIPGSAGGGGFMGSKCFQPGDPGPEWFTVQQQSLKPEAIPAFVQKLEQGDVAKAAEINSGVYVFTVWVKTACKRYGYLVSEKVAHTRCTYDPTCFFELPWGACAYKGES